GRRSCRRSLELEQAHWGSRERPAAAYLYWRSGDGDLAGYRQDRGSRCCTCDPNAAKWIRYREHRGEPVRDRQDGRGGHDPTPIERWLGGGHFRQEPRCEQAHEGRGKER